VGKIDFSMLSDVNRLISVMYMQYRPCLPLEQ